MERYFIVTEKSSLHKDWFDYKTNTHAVNETFKKFVEENEIEANEYYVTSNSVSIIPTEQDTERFGNVLCAPVEQGLRKFKTTSKISKAWVKTLKDADLKVQIKPRLIFYIRSAGGRYRSRMFDIDGILYCSIDPAGEGTPEGFNEIKASEFFKVIEESESA